MQVQYVLARRARRRVIVDKIKTDSGCIDCGYDKEPEALEFDHVEGVKIAGIASMLDLAWPTILAEIQKCVVRCAICHRLATKSRRKPVTPVDDGLSA